MDSLWKSIKISSFNKKAFWASFGIVFILVFLQKAGVRPPKADILTQTPKANAEQQREVREKDLLEPIKPKLEEKPSSFRINPSGSFVPSISAAGSYSQARGYGVIEFDTGNIIVSSELSEKLPIASITKVMTTVVALDLANPNESFRVTQRAADMEPTKLVLLPGEQYSLEELLNASLLTSANDATQTIADGIEKRFGKGVFVKAMNYKAKFLGLQNTSFANPEGFDSPNNYSSVGDLAILTHYALTNYPLVERITHKDREYLEETSTHGSHNLYNWNGLIGVYPDVVGLKIGNTDEAGKTTLVVANRGGKRLISIVLGAPRIIERDIWAGELLDYGYQKILDLDPIEITEQMLRAKYDSWE